MKVINKLNQHVIEPLIEMATQETAGQRIETDKQFIARLRKELYSSFHQFQKRIRFGMKVLTKYQTELHKKRFAQMADSLNATAQNSGNFNLQKQFRISDEEMAQFYQIGINQMELNLIEEASAIFLLLTTLNPNVSSFWLALGFAEEKRGENIEAMKAYLLAGELEENTLAPYFYAANCSLAIHRKEQAREILLRAYEKSAGKPFLEKERNHIKIALDKLV